MILIGRKMTSSNETYPLISVIIPTYNYAFFIKEAINSILAQDYPKDKIEIIVVDDGSSDNTGDILKRWIEEQTISYYYQENKGKANATSKAIQLSKGKYIFNLDADDYFLPGKLSAVVKLFEADDNIVHIANPALFIIDGKETGQEEIPTHIANQKSDGRQLLLHFYNRRFLLGGGSTFAARADVLKKISIPDGVDMYIDEMLVLGMLNKGDSYFIDKPLSVWRGHSANYTVKKMTADAKYKRLGNSSQAIYDLIDKDDSYPQLIRNLYALHHKTRMIYFRELSGHKSLGDIVRYAAFCFNGKYSLQQLRTYSTFNRLLPSFLIRLLKGKQD
ncbi:MAG: glycosyltransferase family A protein [Chitinophagaceae bacterium]